MVLNKNGIKPIEFNTTDPVHIADPKHAILSASDRQQLANSIHANRMIRTLQYMRPEIATAVGRYFISQQWLTPAELAKVIPDKDRPNPAAAFLPIDHRPQLQQDTTSDRRKRRALSISSTESLQQSEAMTTTQ